MNIQTPLDDVNQYPFKEALEEKEEGDLRHDASFDGDFLEYRNVDDILRRVSHALADHIRTGEQMRAKVAHNDNSLLSVNSASSRKALMFSKKYDEEHFVKQQRRYTVMQCQSISPFSCFISAPVVPSLRAPSPKKIFNFLRKIINKAQLDGQCAVVCLVYMERLIRTKPLHLLATNWRPLTMAGVLIAAKMSQDVAPMNKDFQAIYPAFSIKAIKELESELTRLLEWHLQVTKEVYQKYHVALRSLNVNEIPNPPRWAPRASGYHLRKSKLYNLLKVDMPNNKRFERRTNTKHFEKRANMNRATSSSI